MKQLSSALADAGASRFSANQIAAAGLAGALRAATSEISRRHRSEVSQTLMAAKIASLTDRRAARDLYRDLMESGSFDPKAMQAEIGVSTYYDESELPSEEYRDPSLREQLRLALGDDRRDIYIVLSVDPVFLRLHGHSWTQLAPYFKLLGIGIIFIVAGGDDAVSAIADAKKLIEVSVNFRGARHEEFSDAVTFIRCEVPDFVGDQKTFFACARYLLLPDILDVAERPVLVADVDMALRSRIEPFLKRLARVEFACAVRKGLPALYAWRRYMANTVYFGSGRAPAVIARDMSRYIRRGMESRNAWTLDQNALTFAIEQAVTRGDEVTDINTLKRPFFQEDIKIMFEKMPLSSGG